MAQWGAVLLLVPRRDQLVPLHYSIYFDIDLSGPWYTFLWLPGVALAVLITNLIGSLWVDQPIWTRAWLLMTLMIESLALAAIVAVWFHTSSV